MNKRFKRLALVRYTKIFYSMLKIKFIPKGAQPLTKFLLWKAITATHNIKRRKFC